MTLAELIVGAELELRGDGSVELSGVAYDSGQVEPGTLFVCVPGMRVDGHAYAAAAADRGAVALVVERYLELPLPQVRVPDARAAMAKLAARWYDDPTAELALVGITGTNGKTTTAFLLHAILRAGGTQTGLLGTVKSVVGGQEEGVTRTTPEAIDLQRTLRRMVEAGDTACVMEVSSHALELGRTTGLCFDVGAFTNLTQDHLDFHAGLEGYFAAKKKLFEGQAFAGGDPPRRAVINVGDDYGARLATELAAEGDSPELITFSAKGGEATFRASKIEFDAQGSRFLCRWPDGELDIEIPLPGDFNVENALCALALTHALGESVEAGAHALRAVERVPGRFEPVEEGQPFLVLVDYAHTPDSLENVLEAAGRLTDGRVICVFGCGGDRDRTKRPQMGEIGARLSDVAIVTSDNPRSESPAAIIEEIVAGAGGGSVEVEPDRRDAIALALARAEQGDTVVIAGKGHEAGQEFAAGRTAPFDDRDVARSELRRLASG